jgi:hypothetical protein
MPMSARSIPCMSLRCLHGHPGMTGVERTQSRQTAFPLAMAVALVAWVSQTEHLCVNLYRAGFTEHLFPGAGADLRRSR